jgi:hypothetical protein
METVIFKSSSKTNLKLLSELARKLGITVKKLSPEEIEDLGLGAAILEGKTGEYTDTDEFIKKLRK